MAGPEDVVLGFCSEHDRAEALVAPDVIGMEDDPITAVMTRRKSSIVLGCRAVKKGQAVGFFSAGSTGAVTAAGTAYVTPFKVELDGRRTAIRPCLTNALPNRKGGLTVLCDMGANPEVEPMDIVRVAQMGSAYAHCGLGIERPRAGLLCRRGVVMIGHGATSVEAVKNGTLACAEAARQGLVERVASSMGLEA